jgi:hypothetical protein
LILTSPLVHASVKHPHSMILPPTLLHCRDGARFPPDVTLGIQVPFGKLQAGCHVPFNLGVGSVCPLYYKVLIGGELQRWLSFWTVLPSPQRNSGALSE